MKTLIGTLFLLIFLTLSTFAQGVFWRDVPSGELRGVSINDLAGRMRASMEYATKYGFGAGVPTFYHTEKNGQIVYGTLLIPKESVEFKDIPATELGNVGPDDFQERVRQAMTWATNHGYAAGIPTFFDANNGRGTVYGVILMKSDKLKFMDVQRSRVRAFKNSDTAEWARVGTDVARQRSYAGAFPSFHVGKRGTTSEVFGVFFFLK